MSRCWEALGPTHSPSTNVGSPVPCKCTSMGPAEKRFSTGPPWHLRRPYAKAEGAHGYPPRTTPTPHYTSHSPAEAVLGVGTSSQCSQSSMDWHNITQSKSLLSTERDHEVPEGTARPVIVETGFIWSFSMTLLVS